MMGYDSIIITVPAILPNRDLSAFPSTQILVFQRLIIYFLKLAPKEQLCAQNNENFPLNFVFLELKYYSQSLISSLDLIVYNTMIQKAF